MMTDRPLRKNHGCLYDAVRGKETNLARSCDSSFGQTVNVVRNLAGVAEPHVVAAFHHVLKDAAQLPDAMRLAHQKGV